MTTENKHPDHMMEIIGFLSLFAITCIFAIIYYLNADNRATGELVRRLASTPMDDLPNATMLTQQDAWKRPLKFQRSASELQVTQIITSSGKDGKFGTEDDIQCEKTDYNKSRIIGKWVSSRTKEFVKGLKDGEQDTSRFEKLAEPTTKPSTKPSIIDRILKKVTE